MTFRRRLTRRGVVLVPAVLAAAAVALAACAAPAEPPRAAPSDGKDPAGSGPPERFTIVPDDYHVPYAGTAGDGRRFFLSDELFSTRGRGAGTAYVGLFLWNADGTFDEVRVDAVDRPAGLPPGQAGSAGADDLVAARLAELGDYELEPIEVAPFTETVDGETFGWRLSQWEGSYELHVEPGDFIVYYEPWDGRGYDT